jgi:osmotically-inducible protein OsmY
MKTDIEIQKDVTEQLRWEPFLNSSQIGVSVKNGIVTLSGQVDTYSKKVLAEKTVKKVSGVKAIAEDIQVGISPAYKKTDAEIAEAIINALKWHTMIPEDKVKVSVEDGNVKLEGEVEWEYQRNQAKTSVENLAGVKFVSNLIAVKPKVTPYELQLKINASFQRSANIDAAKISADVIGSKVILRGKVRSFAEKEDAENAVWSAPGVTTVENKLVIEEPEYAFED